MSRTSKLARKAKLSAQTKGHNKGKDDTRKSPVPSKQPKPVWVTPKTRKGKGRNRTTEL